MTIGRLVSQQLPDKSPHLASYGDDSDVGTVPAGDAIVDALPMGTPLNCNSGGLHQDPLA